MHRERARTILPVIGFFALLTTACGPDADANATAQAKREHATALAAGIWSIMRADAQQGRAQRGRRTLMGR